MKTRIFHRPRGTISLVGLRGCVIVERVARRYGLTARGLREDTRRANVVEARQHAMSALRDAGFTALAVGQYFGRDHSTVSHSDIVHLRRCAATISVVVAA